MWLCLLDPGYVRNWKQGGDPTHGFIEIGDLRKCFNRKELNLICRPAKGLPNFEIFCYNTVITLF